MKNVEDGCRFILDSHVFAYIIAENISNRVILFYETISVLFVQLFITEHYQA